MRRLQFPTLSVLLSLAGPAASAAELDLAPRPTPEADGEEIVDYDRGKILEAMKQRPVEEGLQLRQVPEGLQVPVLGLVQFPFPPAQKSRAFEPKFLSANDSSGKPDPYTYILRYEGPVTFLIVGTRRVKLGDLGQPDGAAVQPAAAGADFTEINPAVAREEGGDVTNATINITSANLPYTVEVTCDRKTASTCKSRDALKKLVEKLGFAYVP